MICPDTYHTSGFACDDPEVIMAEAADAFAEAEGIHARSEAAAVSSPFLRELLDHWEPHRQDRIRAYRAAERAYEAGRAASLLEACRAAAAEAKAEGEVIATAEAAQLAFAQMPKPKAPRNTRGPSPFKQTDVTRAFKGGRAVDPNAQVKITKDGDLIVSSAAPDDASAAEPNGKTVNDWDEILDGDA